MTKIYSFSGFACNGKTTLMKELNNYGLVFLEHAGMALELGKDVINCYTEDDYLPFQCALASTEIDRIKTWQRNIKHIDCDIYCDRNLLDIITFTLYHAHKTNRIAGNQTKIVTLLAEFVNNNIKNFPIYDKIFLISPNADPEYATKNCLRKDREDTLNLDDFISDENWWFDTYQSIYKLFITHCPGYSRELVILDHPSKIGFDQFYKTVFDQISLNN